MSNGLEMFAYHARQREILARNQRPKTSTDGALLAYLVESAQPRVDHKTVEALKNLVALLASVIEADAAVLAVLGQRELASKSLEAARMATETARRITPFSGPNSGHDTTR